MVVVATSDEPALRRVQAALTATAIAEYFRDLGHNVLLIMDSLTRFAMAQREIGLAAGEPPTTRGYPPSVFAMLLPQLLERAGQAARGSITGFYSRAGRRRRSQRTDLRRRARAARRSYLAVAQTGRAGHYPAIDVLESISRLMTDVTARRISSAAQTVRELMAAYRDHEDLISIGAYRKGANRLVDLAIDLLDDINKYLRQRVDEPVTLESARQGLLELHQRARSGAVIAKS